MDHLEDKIRARAYEIWERDGRVGNPEDHWLEAEREVRAQTVEGQSSEELPEATVEDAPPAAAAAAADAVETGATKSRKRG